MKKLMFYFWVSNTLFIDSMRDLIIHLATYYCSFQTPNSRLETVITDFLSLYS